MLFSTQEFVYYFLPAVVLGFVVLERLAPWRARLIWLLAASVVFYGWWDYHYIALMLASIAGNYVVGLRLAKKPSRPLLTLAIVINLGVLAYYKYTDFLLSIVNDSIGSQFPALNIVLPLAISFHTFQQISYLVEVNAGRCRDDDFLHYALFVSFFPQMIAGPIVRHGEISAQIARTGQMHVTWENARVGIAMFAIGLYKKLVLADGIAVFVAPVFDGAATSNPGLASAWAGALAYTFQIYFDFSAYSDMALGLARIFGITLPLNFHSPYKADSISDFWRRWHISLSRFMRDYVYIPLGGNRVQGWHQLLNLLATMLLAGLWHGAGWTFVFWGLLHGIYLGVNHAWRTWRGEARDTTLGWLGGRLLTFVAVVVAWVFFRAHNFADAMAVLRGMAGLNTGDANTVPANMWAWLLFCLGFTWLLPNTAQLFANHAPALDYGLLARTVRERGEGLAQLLCRARLLWLPVVVGTAVAVALLVMAVTSSQQQNFIYMFF